jgi:serine/threonine-protein kinase RsbW
VLLVETEISNGPYAASEARRTIASLESSLPAHALDDVTLCVSELVTNSYRHGGLASDDSIGLRVELAGTTVRIEVTDRGAGATPAIRDPGEDGGWGLRIVESVADRWGSEEMPGGRVVWFEMEAVT